MPQGIEVRYGQLYAANDNPINTSKLELHIVGVDANNQVIGTEGEFDRFVVVIEMRDDDGESDGWSYPHWQ